MPRQRLPFLMWLEKYLGAAIVLLLGATWRIKQHNPRIGERYLFIFWHRNIVPMLYARRGEGIAVMISSSKDGQLVAGPAEALGYIAIRGSATRGGSKAVRQMVKLGKERGINIVPDGPKGPAEEVKEGVAVTSRLTGLPIIPMSMEVDRAWRLGTWDRMIIPKPFAKIEIHYGEAIPVPGKHEVEETLDIVRRKMKEMHQHNKK